MVDSTVGLYICHLGIARDYTCEPWWVCWSSHSGVVLNLKHKKKLVNQILCVEMNMCVIYEIPV